MTKSDFVELVRTQVTYDNVRRILTILRDYLRQGRSVFDSKMSQEEDNIDIPSVIDIPISML